MSQIYRNYEYGFEIEDILKQFLALIDKSIVMRYEKVQNERRLVQTITPFYKFTTKNRVLLMTLNSAKNFALPCVAVEVTGIKADKERLAAKKALVYRYKHQLLQGYYRPTPITISVKVSIITKYKSDLWQIYGKFCSQFQPECFISWIVPTNIGINSPQELRNKVEWDFNLSMELKDKLQQNQEDRYTGTLNFSIQGWIFHNHRECQGPTILDIGTTSPISDELENRIDGLINHDTPLISQYGSTYKNPRQWATSHIRILKAFNSIKYNNHNYYFRITPSNFNDFQLQGKIKDYSDTNTDKSKDKVYHITLDGYNFDNAEVLLLPKDEYKGKLTTITFDNLAKIQPQIGESKPKPSIIKGIPLEITNRSTNSLTIKLPNISYKGKFDIIVYDRIDYDTIYNAQGFYLNSTK